MPLWQLLEARRVSFLLLVVRGCQRGTPLGLALTHPSASLAATRRLQWRLMLPRSLPAFRAATAAFIEFAAAPGREPVSCSPVSPAERAAARADAATATAGDGAQLRLGRGWFGAAAGGAGAAAPGGYAWQLAERLYSGTQYALAFQLALAPEVAEEELAELGPEWVPPAALLALQVRAEPPHQRGVPAEGRRWPARPHAAAGPGLPSTPATLPPPRYISPPPSMPTPHRLAAQEDVLEVAGACAKGGGGGAARRLARTLQALLGLSTQMQDGMGAERPHRHKQAVAAAIGRLAPTG